MPIDSHAHLESARYAAEGATTSLLSQTRLHRTRNAAFLLLSFSCFSVAPSQEARPAKSLELRLESADLKNGIPESFTFVFVNVGSHDMHVPQVGPCSGLEEGWLRLQLDYKCVVDVPGFGGGCGSGMNDGPGILAIVKSWKTLKPGESLRIQQSRRDMFQSQNCSGTYDFWAEYTPGHLSAADVKILTDAGVDFPREHLTSNHLTFVKK